MKREGRMDKEPNVENESWRPIIQKHFSEKLHEKIAKTSLQYRPIRARGVLIL